MGTKDTFRSVLLFIFLILLSACGGSKETARFEPDPFPEPVAPVEQPAPTPEPEPTFEPDIPKKEPVRLATIHFDFDRSSLTEQAKALLANNARQLRNNPEINIRIEGHCDERGTVEYNLALGERRAQAVRNYLVNFGIAASRMTIISYGKERPVDPRHTPQAWAENRRAEFVILNP